MRYFRDDIKERKPIKVNVPFKKVMMCLNESDLNPMEVLQKEIWDKIATFPINRYFNDVTNELNDLLSDYTGFDKDYFIFGNGADEMLYYVFNSVRNDNNSYAISLSPSYFDYKSYSRAVGLGIKFFHLDNHFDFDADEYMKTGDNKDCKLTIICNPNNPTGNLFDTKKIEYIIKNTPHLVLIDETYFEFSNITFAHLIDKYDNLIIVRSFSKSFSVAGLRFGYILSNPKNIYEIKKVKTYFNLNLLTQAIISVLLKNKDIFLKHNEFVIKERNELYEKLNLIPDLKVWNTNTNFLIFNAGEKSMELFNFLQDNDIAVRNVGQHPIMKNNLRVSISSKEDNSYFYEKIKEFYRGKDVRT